VPGPQPPAKYTERFEVLLTHGQVETVQRQARLLGVSQGAIVRALIELLKNGPNPLEEMHV
jgi:hypothetical protein